MSDLISPSSSSDGTATPSFWQRITNKQVALGTVLVALVILGFALIVALRYVFLMLFLGIVVATALRPVVDRLRRFGLTQNTAALLAFGLLLLIIGGIVTALTPFFVAQFVQALTDLPTFYAGFRATVSNSNSQFLRGLGGQLPADPFNGMALGAQIAGLVPGLASILLFSTLVMILSYYWLYYRALAIQSIALLVPINQRTMAIELWNEIENKIGAFVRGLAILGFVISVLSAIGYLAIGLPYGLTIAVIAGILEAIPYVGPLMTLVLAGLVGLSVSQSMSLLAVGIALAIQLVENSIIVPRLMDRAVGVSPVVTLLALAVFSDLFGLLGALLAVPLAAVFQVLLDRVMLRAAAPADLDIGGRDKLALLRYQTQDLANDLRQQVRAKTEDMDADVDAAEEELEALLLDLDGLLAAAQEQRA